MNNSSISLNTHSTVTTFGYARVSASRQLLDRQIRNLKNAGAKINDIYSDNDSSRGDYNHGLQRLKRKVETGDTILVTKMDRLGSDTIEMIQIINEFDDIGVSIRFIEDGININGKEDGKKILTLLSVVAQAERQRMLEKVNDSRKKQKEISYH